MSKIIPQPLPLADEGKIRKSISARIAFFVLCIGTVLATGLLLNAATVNRTVAVAGINRIPASSISLSEYGRSDAAQRIVFVGTSLIFNGINTEQLTHWMNRSGCNVEVFLAAFPLLGPQEEIAILNQIASLDGPPPDLIVLSAHLASVNVRSNVFQSSPTLHAYAMWNEFQYADPRLAERLRRLNQRSSHLLLGALGQRRLDFVWPSQDVFDTAASNGYIPHEQEDSMDPVATRAAIQYRQAHDPTQMPVLTPAAAQYMASRVSRIQDDVPGLVFTMPTLLRSVGANMFPPGLSSIDGQYLSLNANNADSFPEMFEPENWFNASHLSNRGAIVFAERLAPDLCSVLTTGGGHALR